MQKYILLYAVIVTALLAVVLRRYGDENRRLAQNQTALASEVLHYRTRWGQEAASAQALRLRCAEFEELRAADAARIRLLGIRLRRLEAAGTSVTETVFEARAPLCDTPVVRRGDTLPLCTPVRRFRWEDPWVAVEGLVAEDSVVCRVRSVDTLHQVVHRIPRRFLFIRWGTKALRQEIVSSNPHTRIVYTEYVRLER
ncbi:MAG TPA: hypothetical protein H9920_01255 [Candidatus Alistipes faecavium]|nr:hypothetical protein [Candidatus Alistipes faecavium]